MTELEQRNLAIAMLRRRPWIWTLVTVVAVIALLPPTPACATSGERVTLPLTIANKPGFSKATGLQIVVDSTWSGDRGYRPVRVTVNVATAAAGDTLLTIRYSAGTWRRSDRSMTVEHDFEVPQGATTAQTQFLVPQYSDWNTIEWDVWVDGAKHEALCMSKMGFNASGNGAVAVGRFDMGTSDWRGSGGFLVQSVMSNAVEEQVLDISDLPKSWLEYTTLDVVTTTPNALEFARVSAPDRLVHLLRWVRAGGNLWVMGVGEDFDQLGQLERVLSAAQFEDPADDVSDPPLDQWEFLKFDQKGRQRFNDIVALTMDVAEERQKLTKAELADSRFPDTAADSRQWFVARAYGLGTVLALQDTGVRRRQRDATVTTLQRSAASDNLSWSLRHGNDPSTGNPNFNYWLIADVGAAPVFEFQMLITLFAIAIGPVNYWLLKRQNQLPLMLLTVPIAALGATALLFLYGFLADGISTRARARTLTMLDQSEGELASWARLTYYAGIAPSDGLEMPKDTAVYPVLPSRGSSSTFGRSQSNEQRVAEWQQQQRLTRGWLGSRTPTQYLTMTAKPSELQLAFQRKGDSLIVDNQLGAEVLCLAVQDHQGNVFLAENLPIDGSATLTPSDFVDASSQLRRYFSESILQLPPGYVESNRSRRRNYGDSMTEGLMELHFEAMTLPQAIGWRNGSYVAVTANAIELSLGLADASETESFHVVRGTW
ncbi:MAG: hypothetical protein AAGD11_02560 [Planctomycetota bacterium]